MTGRVCFEAVVEPLVRGRTTYSILRLPPEVAQVLQASGARRVEGEIAEHPVNLALSRTPEVDGVFLWAGKSLLDRLGAQPGERLEVRLRAAPPGAVDTPGDVAAALRRAGKTDAWQCLTPGKKRAALYHIDTAKTGATRAKRIAAMIEGLTE
jgi:hypothetical protein